MKEMKKKKENDDLPANKPPQKAQDKLKNGKDPVEKKKEEAKSMENLELIKKKLALTRDPVEKKRILDSIQQQFGNETAGRVIEEFRVSKEEETKK